MPFTGTPRLKPEPKGIHPWEERGNHSLPFSLSNVISGSRGIFPGSFGGTDSAWPRCEGLRWAHGHSPVHALQHSQA